MYRRHWARACQLPRGAEACYLRRVHAMVLLSGGLDSTTVATHAVRQGHEVRALSIGYGQRLRYHDRLPWCGRWQRYRGIRVQ